MWQIHQKNDKWFFILFYLNSARYILLSHFSFLKFFNFIIQPVSWWWKIFSSCPWQASSPLPVNPPGARSSQREQRECWQQEQCQFSPAGGSKGRGAVAQVGVAADVGVVEVEARGVLLAAHTALRRDGAALLVHRYLKSACGNETSKCRCKSP